MKRITMSLPDDLAEVLEREARRRGVSVSAIAGDALAARLGFRRAADRRSPWFPTVGRNGTPATGRDMEMLIRREWNLEAHSR